jgi:hypothetical protein
MPGPYYCQPYRGVACGFGKGGNPAAIKGRCKFDPRCNEMRCASCCFCARHGLREGRNAGRVAASIAKPKAKAKAQAAPGPPAEAAPRALAPVGRLPDLAVNVMAPHAWYTGMLESVSEASEIIIGTYQYDHEALTNLLEHRLRSRQALDLTILLDREMYTGKTPHGQRALVDRLKRLSAEVVLCRGTRATGSFHIKAVVADRRTAFVGSANITNKSARNAELCLVLRGPPVTKILEILHNEKARGFTLQ